MRFFYSSNKCEFINEIGKETRKRLEMVKIYDDPTLKCFMDEIKTAIDLICNSILSMKELSENINYLRVYSKACKTVAYVLIEKDKKNDRLLEDISLQQIISKEVSQNN